MIEIQGLNSRQLKLADIMWSIDSPESCQRFINSLPDDMRRDAETIKEMILLAFIDECDNTQEAEMVIKQLIDNK